LALTRLISIAIPSGFSPTHRCSQPGPSRPTRLQSKTLWLPETKLFLFWRLWKTRRPGIVGSYTNDLVYERLAPGILEQLEKLNPKYQHGNRRGRHHQLLTDDVGHPALAQHLHAVIGLMRASSAWDQFYRMMNRAFPKRSSTIELAFED
jgi:P63C domain